MLMKNSAVNSNPSLVLLPILFSLNAVAQDSPQRKLPEGASMRLGKGSLTGPVAYSPDGARLAVASSLGIWLYDTTNFSRECPAQRTHGLDRQYGIQSGWLDACDWEWGQNHPSVGCDNGSAQEDT